MTQVAEEINEEGFLKCAETQYTQNWFQWTLMRFEK